MKYSEVWHFLLLVLSILTQIEAKRDFTIDINDYKFNVVRNDYVKKLKYSVLHKKLISVEYVMAKNLTNFKMILKFDMLAKDNRRINLFSLDADGCKILQSIYMNSLLRTIMREVFRKGNIPQRCPIWANEEYYVHNFTVNPEHYPPITPTMSFLITVDIYVNKVYLGAMETRGEIRKI